MPNHLIFNNVASELRTQIYGSDGTNVLPIKTDSSGRLEVVGTFTAMVTPTVVNTMTILNDISGNNSALTIDTSALSIYSFYVMNLGNAAFTVNLQVSPVNDPAYFVDDHSEKVALDPLTTTKAVLVPLHYLKYTRLVYEATAGSITAEIWFNGKG